MAEAGACREYIIPRSTTTDAALVNARETVSPSASATHAASAEAPSWAGTLRAPPNFSGAETGSRFVELWLIFGTGAPSVRHVRLDRNAVREFNLKQARPYDQRLIARDQQLCGRVTGAV